LARGRPFVAEPGTLSAILRRVMPRTEPTVTVAIISFNTRELLLRSLRAIATDVESGPAQVYVVDNRSTDGSLAAAREAAPWARVIDPGANLGFGSAVNLVARRTDTDWLLAANADVALEPGALARLLRAGSRPGIACVAPRLVLADGSTQHSVHPFPTVPFTLAFNLGLPRLAPALGDYLCLEGSWNPEAARTVPWAIGACLLLRRPAFDAVGGFDECQWMYAEDLDLQWRLARQGWRTWYEPRARARHQAAAAAGPAFGQARPARFMAATYAMLRRRRGAARMWITAAINIVGSAARVLGATALSPVSARSRTASVESRVWLRAHINGVRLFLAR
jgi:GT2 family glycosyltransferase